MPLRGQRSSKNFMNTAKKILILRSLGPIGSTPSKNQRKKTEGRYRISRIEHRIKNRIKHRNKDQINKSLYNFLSCFLSWKSCFISCSCVFCFSLSVSQIGQGHIHCLPFWIPFLLIMHSGFWIPSWFVSLLTPIRGSFITISLNQSILQNE